MVPTLASSGSGSVSYKKHSLKFFLILPFYIVSSFKREKLIDKFHQIYCKMWIKFFFRYCVYENFWLHFVTIPVPVPQRSVIKIRFWFATIQFYPDIQYKTYTADAIFSRFPPKTAKERTKAKRKPKAEKFVQKPLLTSSLEFDKQPHLETVHNRKYPTTWHWQLLRR
jgi:hypothetical protein